MKRLFCWFLALVIMAALAAGVPSGTAASAGLYEVWVDDDWNSGSCGGHTWGVDAFDTIAGAVAVVGPNTLVHVLAGTYDEPLDFDGRTNIGIYGEGSPLVQPTSTLPWNVGSYGTSRRTCVRVVNSTLINVSGLTFDFSLVKANLVFGLLYWDSTGQIDGNTFQNMSVSDASGGYYEFGSCLRAPGYTDTSRAAITVSGNSFIDCGRVAILAHDYVNLTISDNSFSKTTPDFGYAIEIGSTSVATISGNAIHGYNTPALSDGSNSAGIYIENCFTAAITTPMAKPVAVNYNEIWDCQWALYVGNEWDGYAGDVDIQLTTCGNYLHDNTDGAVAIADEGASAGSSVTASFAADTITDNGDYGVYAFTYGDGSLHLDFATTTITGHAYGLTVEDAVSPSGSAYDVAVINCDLSGNTTLAVDNLTEAATIGATANWWGDASGPYQATENPGGAGSAISGGVTWTPWYVDAARTTLSSAIPLVTGTRGRGNIVKNPDQATYTYGSSVEMTAVPAAGWSFSRWEGSLTGTTSPATLVIDGLETVTAVFHALPPPPPPPPPAGSTGPFEGESEDGVVEIDAPAGISPDPVVLTVGSAGDPPPTGGDPCLGAYEVILTDAATGGDVTELTGSLTITFHYTAAMLAAAGVTDPHDLRIWYWDVDAEPPCWVALPTTVDETAMTLSTTVDHLTVFAFMADPDFPVLADTVGHWAEADILRLASLGVVDGYEDGSFRPEAAVIRAQFAKFIALSLGLTPGATLPAGFSDAAAVQPWALPYVSACLREGILTGSNGRIRPDDTITRAEAAAMLVRALGLESGAGGTATLGFSDSAAVPAWATAYVAEAVAHGLIDGQPGNVFNADGTLTRAQATTVLSRAIDLRKT